MNAYDETTMWTRAYLQWMDEADEQRKRDIFRSAIFQMASRSQADCERIGESLRALNALRSCDRRSTRPATWEDVLDAATADLHALEAKIQALQSSAH